MATSRTARGFAPRDWAFGLLISPLPKGDPLSQVVRGDYDQLLDPQSPSDARTFKQRYFIYSRHADGPDAPVVYYICGEAECDPARFVGRFAEEAAQMLRAHLVALEHRYYGKSVPFRILTADALKYLSTENALTDLERFQKHAMENLGLRGKWIAMGGSYPGSLAAYYRLKHPELVVGALASSAPVQAKNDFVEYDAHVAQVAGPKCSAALREVVAAAEAALDAGPDAFGRFKARFAAEGINEDRDFLYLLADVAAYAIQYGQPEKLCGPLVAASDKVAAYASHVRDFLESRNQTAVEFSPQGAAALDADASGGMRQWYYQSCTEYGYWQDANPDSLNATRSARLDADYDRDFCRRLFGISELADEEAINARYYRELLKPQTTRIVFTNGTQDPWLHLSINPVRGNAQNPGTPSVMIDKKAHCSDLRASSEFDPESLRSARELFVSSAFGWLR